MVDRFSPSVQSWQFLQASKLSFYQSSPFTCSDVECLFRVMNDKWLLLKVLLVYCFYLKRHYFLDRYFWTILENIFPLLCFLFSILYSYNEDELLYLLSM